MGHSGINVLFEGRNFTRLLGGLWTSVWIAVLSLIIGLALGALFCVLRTSKSRLVKVIFRIYLEFFRIVPTVVLLFLFYYILPRQFNLNWPASVMAVIAFALWVSAEFSDIVRGALISVPKIQRESGLALGSIYDVLNGTSSLNDAIIKTRCANLYLLPATINLATRVIKTTSLLMMISVMDVINVGQQIVEANNKTNPNGVFWVYGLILFLYFIVDYPLSLWAKRLSKRNEA